MLSDEELKEKSYRTEAQFERRRAFAEYGPKALQMMIDKGEGDPEMAEDDALSCQEFEAKYGVEKKDVNYAFVLLEIANHKGDFTKRNEVYDFFIDMLDNAS